MADDYLAEINCSKMNFFGVIFIHLKNLIKYHFTHYSVI